MRLIDADELQAEYKECHNGKRLLLIDVAPTVEPEKRTETHACDCISRQAAIDAFIRKIRPHNNGDGTITMCVMSEELVRKTMDDLPSAQLERKKGKWIPVTNGRGGHECDLCHNYAPAWQTGEERLTDFCPNCGAYMGATGGENDV